MPAFPLIPAKTALINVDMQRCFVEGTRWPPLTDARWSTRSTGDPHLPRRWACRPSTPVGGWPGTVPTSA